MYIYIKNVLYASYVENKKKIWFDCVAGNITNLDLYSNVVFVCC